MRHVRILTLSAALAWAALASGTTSAAPPPQDARAWIAVGGYHPSARPSDFVADTPDVTGLRPADVSRLFDFVVVGDGEGRVFA